MSEVFDVVIVGAGQAGAQVAATLRQRGFGGSIALIGEDRELPYARPPLSKEYLCGETSFDRMLLRPGKYWQERNVSVRVGCRAKHIRLESRAVVLEDGSSLGYGELVWAAGGAARRLGCPGHDLPGVHSVRTRADVDRILGSLDAVTRVAIVGGGFIGLEAAAAMVKRGKQVTVLEAQDRVLARVSGLHIARFFESEHRRRGVDLRLGTTIERIDGSGGRVSAIRTTLGEVIPAEMVIVGIGILPEVEPLADAGAEVSNGVLVDEYCRTSIPKIYAVGDCALHANPHAGGARIRLESVQNANDMAAVAAKSILGSPEPYNALPWFWSNQYDLRLQTAGVCHKFDREILRGSREDRAFSVAYVKEGRLIAMDCVNAAKDFVQAKTLIASGGEVEISKLADAAQPLVARSGSE